LTFKEPVMEMKVEVKEEPCDFFLIDNVEYMSENCENITHKVNCVDNLKIKKEVEFDNKEDWLKKEDVYPECLVKIEEGEWQNSQKPFQCIECRRSFQDSFMLNKHMISHTHDRSYECLECNKKFISINSLKRHKLSHNGEKPFVCEVCGYEFLQISKLKDHMQIHSGKKDLECSICKDQFVREHNLIQHMFVHTEKLYDCPECNKKFKSQGYLDRHIKTHKSNEKVVKKFQCDECDQKYVKLANLNKHKWNHRFKVEQINAKQRHKVYNDEKLDVNTKQIKNSVTVVQKSSSVTIKFKDRQSLPLKNLVIDDGARARSGDCGYLGRGGGFHRVRRYDGSLLGRYGGGVLGRSGPPRS